MIQEWKSINLKRVIKHGKAKHFFVRKLQEFSWSPVPPSGKTQYHNSIPQSQWHGWNQHLTRNSATHQSAGNTETRDPSDWSYKSVLQRFGGEEELLKKWVNQKKNTTKPISSRTPHIQAHCLCLRYLTMIRNIPSKTPVFRYWDKDFGPVVKCFRTGESS